MDNSFEFKPQNGADGGGSGGKTRIGSSVPGDSGRSKRVRIDCHLTLTELAARLGTSETTVIRHLMSVHGVLRTVNQIVELDLARKTAIGMGYEIIDR